MPRGRPGASQLEGLLPPPSSCILLCRDWLGCSFIAISSARCPVLWLTSPASHRPLHTGTVQPSTLHVIAKAPNPGSKNTALTSTRGAFTSTSTACCSWPRGAESGPPPDSPPGASGPPTTARSDDADLFWHALRSPSLGPPPGSKATSTVLDVTAVPPLLGNNFRCLLGLI